MAFPIKAIVFTGCRLFHNSQLFLHFFNLGGLLRIRFKILYVSVMNCEMRLIRPKYKKTASYLKNNIILRNFSKDFLNLK